MIDFIKDKYKDRSEFVMQGIATITRKNVETEKEDFVLTYKISGAKNEKTLCDMKSQFDRILIKKGGQTTLDSSDDDDEV